MKCGILGCDELATYPFHTHDSLHGKMLRVAKLAVIYKLKGEKVDSEWRHYFNTEEPSEEEIEWYKQFIN